MSPTLKSYVGFFHLWRVWSDCIYLVFQVLHKSSFTRFHRLREVIFIPLLMTLEGGAFNGLPIRKFPDVRTSSSSDVEEICVRGLELRVVSASISTVVSSW